MNQTLTDDQYKIKVLGEASNLVFRMKEEEIKNNIEWNHILQGMGITQYN